MSEDNMAVNDPDSLRLVVGLTLHGNSDSSLFKLSLRTHPPQKQSLERIRQGYPGRIEPDETILQEQEFLLQEGLAKFLFDSLKDSFEKS